MCLSVCLSVCHVSEPCKNGWTDHDALWELTSVGRKNHVLHGGRYPPVKGQFWGMSGPLKSIGRQCCGALGSKKINNGNSGAAAAGCNASDCHITLFALWKIRSPMRRYLLSKFFDHLFILCTMYSKVRFATFTKITSSAWCATLCYSVLYAVVVCPSVTSRCHGICPPPSKVRRLPKYYRRPANNWTL